MRRKSIVSDVEFAVLIILSHRILLLEIHKMNSDLNLRVKGIGVEVTNLVRDLKLKDFGMLNPFLSHILH